MVEAPKWAGLPIGEALVFAYSFGGDLVGITATKILDADPYRVAVSFSTTQGGVAYVGLDKTVAVNNGIQLDYRGGTFVITDQQQPGLAGQAWWAIGAAAGEGVAWITTRLIE